MEQLEEFNFSAQTVQNWEEAAIKELEGTGSLKKLMVEKGGLTIKPYYTGEDMALANIAPLAASANPYGGARYWANMPKVIVNDPKQANEQALFYLQNGADGICFELIDSVEVEKLLDKIELPYCLINFLVSSQHTPFLNSFHAFAEKKYKKAEITGNIFWKEAPDFSLIKKFNDWYSFQSCGVIVIPRLNMADEIAEAINKGVNAIENQKENGTSVEEAFQQIAFSISTGNDFFLEIAKLKALRACWQNIERAYGIQNSTPIFIHATSTAWINATYQPHGNLIKETYSGLSSILGGCDGLTIEPEDYHNTTMNRMARNTSSVLREESFLSQVADPLAGSYFIESITQALAKQSWKKFQELSK